MGDSLAVDKVYRSCIVTVQEYDTQADLIMYYWIVLPRSLP